MSEFLHLVATSEDPYGWSLSSPQVPDLVYGRSDLVAFRRGIEDVLAFVDAPDLPRQIHEQVRGEAPDGGQFRIRIAADQARRERIAIAEQVRIAIPHDDQHEEMLDPRRLSNSGDAVFVVVLPSDNLGWLFDQVDVRDGLINIVGADSDPSQIWTTVVSGCDEGRSDMVSLSEMGLSFDDTIATMRERMNADVVGEDKVLTPA